MLAKASKSVQAANVEQVIPQRVTIPSGPLRSGELDKIRKAIVLGIRPTYAEDQLNKTETAYYRWLQTLGDLWIGVMCLKLTLSKNTTYTPDFWACDQNGMRAIDVKGTKAVDGRHTYWCEEDAKVKIKLAARLYPWARFLIAFQYPRGFWNHVPIEP